MNKLAFLFMSLMSMSSYLVQAQEMLPNCCNRVVVLEELPESQVRLITAHGCIHIIFWAGFLMLHTALIMYKRYHSNNPFNPPHDVKFRIYMLVHHIVGFMDIGAIIMALAFAGKNGDKAKDLLDDEKYAGAHRIAGIIILPTALFMELEPLFFERFNNPHINYILRVIHKTVGKILLVWVVVFQLWSGIRMIGWHPKIISALYTWLAACLIVIAALVITGIRKQSSRVHVLTSKFASKSNAVPQNRIISAEELAKHTDENDAWIAINGYVIDVTGFLHDHPGGVIILLKFAGKDASYAWNLNHERDFIAKYVSGLVIGVLEGSDPKIIEELKSGRANAVEAGGNQYGADQEMASLTNNQPTSFATKFSGPRVIIIGGGLSGLSAAHSAIQHGARVLILDKMAFCGGNSMKATSGINGANTRIQAALGIKDNWEQFCSDTYKSAAKGAPDAHSYELAEVLTKNSADAVHWLIDHFSLNLCEIGRLAGQSAARTHRGATRFPGMMITSKLLDDIKGIANDGSGTVEIINRARVTKLIQKPDPKTGRSRVVGVEYDAPDGHHVADNEDGCIVIATGGWGCDFGSDSILAKYRPDLINLPTTNGEHCTGDGVKIAEAIGAGMIGLDWVQVHPTGLVDPLSPTAKVKTLAAEALRGADGLIFNRHGKRFCNELGRRDYVSGEMMKNEGPFYLVLNSSGYSEMKWHLDHYSSMNLFHRYENGKELAKLIGCPPENIDETMKLYQSHAAFQHQSDIASNPIEHDSNFWVTINAVKDPYGKPVFKYPASWRLDDFVYAAQITTVVHYCMGGIKINSKAEVCQKGSETNDYYTSDENHGNVPIAGLFACGETTGGVHGKNRLGGSSLLDCVVFGKIAGTSAATYLENVTNRVAMIGVQTVDTSDPDLIVEAANKRLLASGGVSGGVGATAK